MCQYWKKIHTCTHLSDRRYIEMCRPGYLSNTVCPSITEDLEPRASHFPCWQCIKQSVRAEAQDKHSLVFAAATAANLAREKAVKHSMDDEKRRREERVRREAREKAERERIAEQKVRVEREKEMEKARREGGAWVLAEAGSGKKKKVKAMGLANPSSPVRPASPSSPASPVGTTKKGVWKENEKAVEMSGRAGTWGPKRILSRKEGVAVLECVAGGTGENGVKK